MEISTNYLKNIISLVVTLGFLIQGSFPFALAQSPATAALPQSKNFNKENLTVEDFQAPNVGADLVAGGIAGLDECANEPLGEFGAALSSNMTAMAVDFLGGAGLMDQVGEIAATAGNILSAAQGITEIASLVPAFKPFAEGLNTLLGGGEKVADAGTKQTVQTVSKTVLNSSQHLAKLQSKTASIDASGQKDILATLQGMQVSDNCLDRMVFIQGQRLIFEMRNQVAEWIVDGFEGDNPGFVQNEKQRKRDIAQATWLDFLNPKSDQFKSVCSAFRTDVVFNIRQAYNRSFGGDESQVVPEVDLATTEEALLRNAIARDATHDVGDNCMLDRITGSEGNTVEFMDGNFSVGGWDAWVAMFNDPGSNPNFATQELTSELQGNIQEAQQMDSAMLDRSGGFLSDRVCANGLPAGIVGLCVDGSEPITVTPGIVVGNIVNEMLASDVRRAELVDEVGEVIESIGMTLIGQLLPRTGRNGGYGLANVSARNFEEAFTRAYRDVEGGINNPESFSAELVDRHTNIESGMYDIFSDIWLLRNSILENSCINASLQSQLSLTELDAMINNIIPGSQYSTESETSYEIPGTLQKVDWVGNKLNWEPGETYGSDCSQDVYGDWTSRAERTYIPENFVQNPRFSFSVNPDSFYWNVYICTPLSDLGPEGDTSQGINRWIRLNYSPPAYRKADNRAKVDWNNRPFNWKYYDPFNNKNLYGVQCTTENEDQYSYSVGSEILDQKRISKPSNSDFNNIKLDKVPKYIEAIDVSRASWEGYIAQLLGFNDYYFDGESIDYDGSGKEQGPESNIEITIGLTNALKYLVGSNLNDQYFKKASELDDVTSTLANNGIDDDGDGEIDDKRFISNPSPFAMSEIEAYRGYRVESHIDDSYDHPVLRLGSPDNSINPENDPEKPGYAGGNIDDDGDGCVDDWDSNPDGRARYDNGGCLPGGDYANGEDEIVPHINARVPESNYYFEPQSIWQKNTCKVSPVLSSKGEGQANQQYRNYRASLIKQSDLVDGFKESRIPDALDILLANITINLDGFGDLQAPEPVIDGVEESAKINQVELIDEGLLDIQQRVANGLTIPLAAAAFNNLSVARNLHDSREYQTAQTGYNQIKSKYRNLLEGINNCPIDTEDPINEILADGKLFVDGVAPYNHNLSLLPDHNEPITISWETNEYCQNGTYLYIDEVLHEGRTVTNGSVTTSKFIDKAISSTYELYCGHPIKYTADPIMADPNVYNGKLLDFVTINSTTSSNRGVIGSIPESSGVLTINGRGNDFETTIDNTDIEISWITDQCPTNITLYRDQTNLYKGLGDTNFHDNEISDLGDYIYRLYCGDPVTIDPDQDSDDFYKLLDEIMVTVTPVINSCSITALITNDTTGSDSGSAGDTFTLSWTVKGEVGSAVSVNSSNDPRFNNSVYPANVERYLDELDIPDQIGVYDYEFTVTCANGDTTYDYDNFTVTSSSKDNNGFDDDYDTCIDDTSIDGDGDCDDGGSYDEPEPDFDKDGDGVIDDRDGRDNDNDGCIDDSYIDPDGDCDNGGDYTRGEDEIGSGGQGGSLEDPRLNGRDDDGDGQVDEDSNSAYANPETGSQATDGIDNDGDGAIDDTVYDPDGHLNNGGNYVSDERTPIGGEVIIIDDATDEETGYSFWVWISITLIVLIGGVLVWRWRKRKQRGY